MGVPAATLQPGGEGAAVLGSSWCGGGEHSAPKQVDIITFKNMKVCAGVGGQGLPELLAALAAWTDATH